MLPRHPNLIWEQLAADELAASFIVDGHHLPAATVKVMVRAKSLARSHAGDRRHRRRRAARPAATRSAASRCELDRTAASSLPGTPLLWPAPH